MNENSSIHIRSSLVFLFQHTRQFSIFLLVKVYAMFLESIMASTNDSDVTLSDAARNTWSSWIILVILGSLTGDSIILIASIKYKAFKFHKVIVTIIQHVALCDLYSTSYTLVNVVSLITNSNINIYFCYMAFWTTYQGVIVSVNLICALSVSKLILLKFPLRSASWSGRLTHRFCAVIWTVAHLLPALHILVDKEGVSFDHRIHQCMYQYTSETGKLLLLVTTQLALLVPNLISNIATVLLLGEARKGAKKMNRGLRRQGLITVIITATIYTLSYLPFAIYCTVYLIDLIREETSGSPQFYIYYYRVASNLVYLNIITNFFVYTMTVKSFRHWLKTKLFNFEGIELLYFFIM